MYFPFYFKVFQQGVADAIQLVYHTETFWYVKHQQINTNYFSHTTEIEQALFKLPDTMKMWRERKKDYQAGNLRMF